MSSAREPAVQKSRHLETFLPFLGTRSRPGAVPSFAAAVSARVAAALALGLRGRAIGSGAPSGISSGHTQHPRPATAPAPCDARLCPFVKQGSALPSQVLDMPTGADYDHQATKRQRLMGIAALTIAVVAVHVYQASTADAA